MIMLSRAPLSQRGLCSFYEFVLIHTTTLHLSRRAVNLNYDRQTVRVGWWLHVSKHFFYNFVFTKFLFENIDNMCCNEVKKGWGLKSNTFALLNTPRLWCTVPSCAVMCAYYMLKVTSPDDRRPKNGRGPVYTQWRNYEISYSQIP